LDLPAAQASTILALHASACVVFGLRVHRSSVSLSSSVSVRGASGRATSILLFPLLIHDEPSFVNEVMTKQGVSFVFNPANRKPPWVFQGCVNCSTTIFQKAE